MTIVVNDLVARFRSDTSDVERGQQVARRELAATAEQARATGEQIDQLARRFAQTQGGTAGQWAAILQQQHLSARQVAEALGQGADNAGRAASATQQMVQPTQAAAKAAADMHEGWRLSESSIVRFGASLVGVGLGISLVAGAGRVLHDAIAGIVEGQLAWERSVRVVNALYGDLAPRVLTVAQAQAALPGGLGSAQENVQALLSARYLTSRYGVPQQQVEQLVTTGVRAAGFLGLTDARDRAALQARLLQFAESGGDSLRDFDVQGDPEAIARRLGFASGASLGALTPAQLRQAQLLIGTEGVNRLAATSVDQDSLLSRRAQLEQAILVAQGNLVRGAGPSIVEPLGPELTGRLPGTPYENFPRTLEETARDQVRQLQEQLDGVNRELGTATQAAADAAAQLNKMGVEAGGAAARLLAFTGSLEDRLSIARGDVGVQAQAAVAARMRSAIPGIGTPAREIAALANQDAFAAAYQNYVARIAQQNPDNAVREFLQRRAESEAQNLTDRQLDRGGLGLTPAGHALREAEQTAPVLERMRTAQQAAAQIDLATAERQADLEAITLRQRERGLQFIRETIDLRRLDLEQQRAVIGAGAAVTQAQIAGLGPQRALEDAQYQSTRAGVLARARVARLMQGRSAEGLPSFDELIRMNVQGQFAEAETGPAALEAGRAIQLAQRPATAAALAQSVTQSQLQLGQLAVDLQNLGDLPEQTALELELVQTNRDQLQVQRELRDATRQLVDIMSGGLTVTVDATAAVEGVVRQGLRGSNAAQPPVPSQLAGARR